MCITKLKNIRTQLCFFGYKQVVEQFHSFLPPTPKTNYAPFEFSSLGMYGNHLTILKEEQMNKFSSSKSLTIDLKFVIS